eukprot:6212583-Pleurochrysis_carterae.AAC.5
MPAHEYAADYRSGVRAAQTRQYHKHYQENAPRGGFSHSWMSVSTECFDKSVLSVVLVEHKPLGELNKCSFRVRHGPIPLTTSPPVSLHRDSSAALKASVSITTARDSTVAENTNTHLLQPIRAQRLVGVVLGQRHIQAQLSLSAGWERACCASESVRGRGGGIREGSEQAAAIVRREGECRGQCRPVPEHAPSIAHQQPQERAARGRNYNSTFADSAAWPGAAPATTAEALDARQLLMEVCLRPNTKECTLASEWCSTL